MRVKIDRLVVEIPRRREVYTLARGERVPPLVLDCMSKAERAATLEDPATLDRTKRAATQPERRTTKRKTDKPGG